MTLRWAPSSECVELSVIQLIILLPLPDIGEVIHHS